MDSEQEQQSPKLPLRGLMLAKIRVMHDAGIAATAAAVAVKADKEAEALAEQKREAAEIGDRLEDGTVYAGISPTTQQRMYVVPADAPLTMTFNNAAKYAEDLEFGGHNDFRVPDKDELNVLFENKDKGALRGTFSEIDGSYTNGFYWSSDEFSPVHGLNQRFKDGLRMDTSKYDRNLVRCVR